MTHEHLKRQAARLQELAQLNCPWNIIEFSIASMAIEALGGKWRLIVHVALMAIADTSIQLSLWFRRVFLRQTETQAINKILKFRGPADSPEGGDDAA